MTDASLSRIPKLPTAFWPACTAIFLQTWWFVSPASMKFTVAGIAALLILFAGFRFPTFGLATLLTITPFQPFLDYYCPSLGSLYAGAAMRDGLLVIVSLRWAADRWFSDRESRLDNPQKMVLLYM